MSARCKRSVWAGQHHQSGNLLKVNTRKKSFGGKVVVLYEKKGVRFRQLCELSLNVKNAISFMERLGQDYQKGEIEDDVLSERCRQQSTSSRKGRVNRGPAAEEPATRSAGAVSGMVEFEGKVELSDDPVEPTTQATIGDVSLACDSTPVHSSDFLVLIGLITDPPVYCGGIYADSVDSE